MVQNSITLRSCEDDSGFEFPTHLIRAEDPVALDCHPRIRWDHGNDETFDIRIERFIYSRNNRVAYRHRYTFLGLSIEDYVEGRLRVISIPEVEVKVILTLAPQDFCMNVTLRIGFGLGDSLKDSACQFDLGAS